MARKHKPGSSQEGTVGSAAGGPAGADDRKGEGATAVERRSRRREEGRPLDAFVSSEVDARTRKRGGYDRTRG